MCNITKYQENLEALEDFFEYVNTNIFSELAWEDEMYAAYATAYDLPILTIGQWHTDCEDAWVPQVDAYLGYKYEVWSEEGIQYNFEKEIDEGILRECAGYWFATE